MQNQSALTRASPPYFFTLDKTALLVVFREEGQVPVVMQVIVKSARGRASIDELAKYFTIQMDVSQAVTSIVRSWVGGRGVPPAVTVHGEGYVLRGELRRWEYGQRRLGGPNNDGPRLCWGSSVLEPWTDKGVFVLECC